MALQTQVLFLFCIVAVAKTLPTSDQPKGDVGFTMSGSAERPSDSRKTRPTVEDVIKALENLVPNAEPGKDRSKDPNATNEPCNPNDPKTTPLIPTYPTITPDHSTTPPPYYSTPAPSYGTPPVFPPKDIGPLQTYYPPLQPPVPPTVEPVEINPGMFPIQPDNNGNHSIIILNLQDSQVLEYDGSNIMELLNTVNGKPGFVYVTVGGQGKFIPLNQLHLLPQGVVPSYIVLLADGHPKPVPGLQLINGFPNLNQGNLGFQIPNLGSFSSLPIYVVQGYYPIWTILMNLGMYEPNHNLYLPHPDPTPYPVHFRTTLAPPTASWIRPTNPPVVRPNLPPQSDISQLIKIILKILNENPGSETSQVITSTIIQEKRDPIRLLRILIELLCRKTGLDEVIYQVQNENNPSKLLQVLIQLLNQKNAVSGGYMSRGNHNSEQQLIQLLTKLIYQQENQVVVTSNNNGNQEQLMQILLQLLGNQHQPKQVVISNQGSSNQMHSIQSLKQLLGASNPEVNKIFISGGNDVSNAQKLYNILLQTISSVNSNVGSGFSGISSNSLMQLVEILLKEQQPNPTISLSRHTNQYGESSYLDDKSKILTMLLGTGGGKANNKTALWSYLLGNLGCMNHNGQTFICAK